AENEAAERGEVTVSWLITAYHDLQRLQGQVVHFRDGHSRKRADSQPVIDPLVGQCAVDYRRVVRRGDIEGGRGVKHGAGHVTIVGADGEMGGLGSGDGDAILDRNKDQTVERGSNVGAKSVQGISAGRS